MVHEEEEEEEEVVEVEQFVYVSRQEVSVAPDGKRESCPFG